MQTAPEADPDWNKTRLVELGLDRQIVDKLTTDEARLVLKNITYMMEKKKATPFYEKLDADQLISVANAAADKLDLVMSRVSHRPVAAAAAQAVNVATMSAVKCKPLLRRVIHTIRNKMDSSPANEWARQGFIFVNQGKYASALEYFDRATEARPDDGRAWNGKGDVLFRLGRFSESARCYERFLRLHPSDAQAWNNKGACMFNMAKYGSAIECFDRALAINATSAQAWYGKACAAVKARRLEESLQCLTRAVELGGEEYRKAARGNHAFLALRSDDRFAVLTGTQEKPGQ